MTEITSRGGFNVDQTKRVQDGGWMRVGNECPKDPKLGIRKKFLSVFTFKKSLKMYHFKEAFDF